MKVHFPYWLCFSIVLGCFSCEEVPVQVIPVAEQGECATIDRSIIEAQQRQVLIEEFTGVRCVNCPEGSEEIKALINQYGEQIVAISIHSGFFSNPYPESLFDLRTNVGDALLNFLGAPLGYPAAIINRKNFGSGTRLHLGRPSWANAVITELNSEPEVKIGLETAFQPTDRSLQINISLLFETAQTETVRLSVFIVENNVQDYQETPAGLQSDYVHDHVLRSSLTSFTGDIIQESTEEGAFFCKQLTTAISSDWKEEDCTVVAFVHSGSEEKIILQAHEVSVVR